MKFVLFGNKTTTLFLAKKLLNLSHEVCLITISKECAAKNLVADYLDMSELHDVFSDIIVVNDYSLRSFDVLSVPFLGDCRLGFSIGWQRIIPSNVLSHFNRGVFGMHGSARDLPYGRGRSPMNWSIIEGRNFFHTNLFQYLPGIDDGPIIGRSTFSILDNDNAETLHIKNTLAMSSLLANNLESMMNGTVVLNPQKTGTSTFYPKREPKHGLIDWSADCIAIDRLVRAVSFPFDGAYSYCNGERISIHRVQIFYTDLEDHPYKNARPGQICEIFNGKFIVKAELGVILITDWSSKSKNISVNDFLDNNGCEVHYFMRNIHGNFDLE